MQLEGPVVAGCQGNQQIGVDAECSAPRAVKGYGTLVISAEQGDLPVVEHEVGAAGVLEGGNGINELNVAGTDGIRQTGHLQYRVEIIRTSRPNRDRAGERVVRIAQVDGLGNIVWMLEGDAAVAADRAAEREGFSVAREENPHDRSIVQHNRMCIRRGLVSAAREQGIIRRGTVEGDAGAGRAERGFRGEAGSVVHKDIPRIDHRAATIAVGAAADRREPDATAGGYCAILEGLLASQDQGQDTTAIVGDRRANRHPAAAASGQVEIPGRGAGQRQCPRAAGGDGQDAAAAVEDTVGAEIVARGQQGRTGDLHAGARRGRGDRAASLSRGDLERAAPHVDHIINGSERQTSGGRGSTKHYRIVIVEGVGGERDGGVA